MRLSAILAVILGVILLIPAAAWCGPNYRFQVEKNVSNVYIKKDGSIDIEYSITFLNKGDPIDVVDIGLPHDGYRLNTAYADINGFVLSKIKRSSYIAVGVEVHLGEHAIPNGQRGTLNFSINNPKMVFPDTENPEYASVQFAPTWFDPSLSVGRTRLEVNVHFPEGVTGQETKWHAVQYTRDAHVDGRLVFTWVKPDAGQKKHMVGVSFPRKYVDKVFDKSDVKFVDSVKPKKPFNWGAFLEWAPYIFILFIVIVGAITGAVAKRSKRMHYLPPETKIEGLGPCKDLDPIEAAVVMELPLSKVIALIMMQLVQKECLEVRQVHPLRVNILRKEGSDLKDYERSVLKALEPAKFDDEKTRERRLSNAVVHLVEGVRDKMKKGYSRTATANFYRGKVKHMWNICEKNPEVEHLSWIALDENCTKKLEESPERKKKLESIWGNRYDRFFRYRSYRRGPYYWMHDVENEMVPNNSSFTEGVSKVTNPSAWISSSGWSSGGGGGFSCACACAGCACACAGGGR